MNSSNSHQPPSRRRLTFSLRALFIFMLAHGVLIGWMSLAVRRVEVQRRAVAAIENMGGTVEYEMLSLQDPIWGSPPLCQPRWLRDRVPRDFFDAIKQVTLPREVHVTDAECSYLAQLATIESLTIYGNDDLTDDGLRQLVHITSLQSLTIHHSAITGEGFRHCAKLHNLRSLTLRRSPITDDGLRHLVDLPNLRSLEIITSAITDDGIKTIAQMKRLEHLRIDGAAITDASVPVFQRMTRLESFSIWDTDMSWQALDQLRQSHLHANP